MLAQVLGMHLRGDRVGDGDRPVLRDVVLDVHRTHCGEREIEPCDQRHDRRERQRERIGQRHRVAEL
jgi:hypothetical protein